MSIIEEGYALYLEMSPYPEYFLGIIIFYLIYRWYLNGITFEVFGQYNRKLKNLGHPIPPFPNGWFVAAHSYDVKKGESMSVDING